MCPGEILSGVNIDATCVRPKLASVDRTRTARRLAAILPVARRARYRRSRQIDDCSASFSSQCSVGPMFVAPSWFANSGVFASISRVAAQKHVGYRAALQVSHVIQQAGLTTRPFQSYVS
jgi:hypothetical protein